MQIDILGNSLFKSLLDKTITFHDVMSIYNVRTHISNNLSSCIYAFVYLSRKGNYHLIINGNISYESQCKTFIHEIKHITYDLPNMCYIVGINMQYTEIEIDADFIAEHFYNTLNYDNL